MNCHSELLLPDLNHQTDSFSFNIHVIVAYVVFVSVFILPKNIIFAYRTVNLLFLC